MRPKVIAFTSLPPLPKTVGTADVSIPSEEEFNLYDEALEQIQAPVSNEEAKALVKMFGPDDCFGLAWVLLRLIETAPGWPLEECLQNTENMWIQLLKNRYDNWLKSAQNGIK